MQMAFNLSHELSSVRRKNTVMDAIVVLSNPDFYKSDFDCGIEKMR